MVLEDGFVCCDCMNGDQGLGLKSRGKSDEGNSSPWLQPLDLSFLKDKMPCTRSRAREMRVCLSAVTAKAGTHKSPRLRMLSTPTSVEAMQKKRTDKPARKASSESFPCIECKFCSKSARELYWHMKDVHPLAKPYQCSDCGLWFNTMHDRCIHSNSVHAQEVLSCTLCNFTTYNQFQLRNHEQMHRNKNLQCDYCDVSLSSMSALREHQAWHFDKQTYPCEYCDKSFASALLCQIHITGKYGPGFVCLWCEQCFDSTFQLAKHKKWYGKGAS